MSDADAEQAEYEYLQTPRAIRERCTRVAELARADELRHWRLDESRLKDVEERVLRVTRSSYPDLSRIPYHGRYRHFDVGGVPRLRDFETRIRELPSDAQLAARVELVVSSVLLDAGAGPEWRYRGEDGAVYHRSEGLAVASYELYCSGALGSGAGALLADPKGLSELTPAVLARAFQVDSQNPLTGLDGRSRLLARLGLTIERSPDYFGSTAPRLGNLGIWLKRSAQGGVLRANAILSAVLSALGPIWQDRQVLAQRSLGDVWRHSEVGFVPFHKLSQWLTYSLFEPLEAAGLCIEGADELTGLAEYRNGGLFVDAGVLALRDSAAAHVVHDVDSDLIIEWRALTVSLLDRVAASLRDHLGVSAEQLPLARILEGGTWRAGRAIAQELRSDGRPPLMIASDGTVF